MSKATRDEQWAAELFDRVSDDDRDEWVRVVADALAEAERAQMERDCVAVCGKCRIGEELKYYDGDWYHLFRGHLHNGCSARLIRAAFAALHPEPAP